MARFQLDIPQDKIDEIEQLMAATHTPTKKAFVNNAITLLKWAIRQRQNGYLVTSYDEERDRLRELEMPILDRIKPHQNEVVKGGDQHAKSTGPETK